MNMKRIIVAGLHHESNTFTPIITDVDDFRILRGREILDALNDSDSISGIIDTLTVKEDYEIIPILMARAVPNGIIRRTLYEELKEELLNGIRDTGPVDAFTLSLHGSMRIEEIGEAEGDLLESIREIHPHIPIICALDMHATVTGRMLKHADAFVGYKQAPHTDCYKTGVHAAELTLETLESGKQLSMGWCRVPMLIAGEKSETSVEPMYSMIEALRRTENHQILAASFLLGFPWADCEENNVTALVVTSGNKTLAVETAEKLGTMFWERRRDFQFHTETYEPETALEKALESRKTPVYLSDSGDNPTAGSSADCTNFLRQILGNRKATALSPPLLFTGLYDPEAVAMCKNRTGEKLTIKAGALFDTESCRPLILTGRVMAYVESWGLMKSDLVLFWTGGIDLILASKHIGFTETELFDALNIDHMNRKLIVVKIGYLSSSFKKVARRSIMALSDGSSNEKLENLPYQNLDRPLYPLDPDMKPALTGY